MHRLLTGIVRGRTIELECDPQLDEGSLVEVVLRIKTPVLLPPEWKPGSPSASAGWMADEWTDDDDRILAQIADDRRRDTRREPRA